MTMPSIAEVHAALTAPGQMFEMEEVVIRGVPTRTWKHAPASLRVVLENSRSHVGKDFLVYEDETWSFERHYREASHLAHVLRDRFGVRPGDRVAIAMRNYPEWSIAFWAAASAGAVVVPLNAWWTGPELQYGLEDSGSVVAFVDAERLDRIAPHLGELPALQAVVSARDDRAVLPGGALAFGDVLGEVPEHATQPEVDVAPEDDATIFYTSGTTWKPKGALGTHRNICTNLMSLVFCSARAAARATSPELAASTRRAAGSRSP